MIDKNGYTLHMGDLVKYHNRYWIVSAINVNDVFLTAVVRVLPVSVSVPCLNIQDVEIVEGYDKVELMESFTERQNKA